MFIVVWFSVSATLLISYINSSPFNDGGRRQVPICVLLLARAGAHLRSVIIKESIINNLYNNGMCLFFIFSIDELKKSKFNFKIFSDHVYNVSCYTKSIYAFQVYMDYFCQQTNNFPVLMPYLIDNNI